jgi:hypothetical protein
MELIIAIVIVIIGVLIWKGRKVKAAQTEESTVNKVDEVTVAPYKVEAPVVEEALALVKKPRKPRAPKAEKPVAKTAKVTKAPVAKKTRAKKV